jgi:ABC-type polysaccharide transport system permease subunit
LGAIISLVGILTGNLVVGIVAAFLTIISAIFQYLLSKPFIKEFDEKDWLESGDEYTLKIPSSRHWRGHGASAKVYQVAGDSYEVVMCDEVEERDGAFLLRARVRFQGRLVLK